MTSHASTSVASGAEIHWNGAVNTRFTEPGNWAGGRVPGRGDSALVSANEPFVSGVVIEVDDDIRVDNIWMDLVGTPRDHGIQFEIQGGTLNAATFHVVDSRWPSVGGGAVVAIDELIIGPAADQPSPQGGMSIRNAMLDVGQGGIRLTAEDPEWTTTIVVEEASIDLTRAIDGPFHVSHGTLEVLMAPGSRMRLPGQISLPGDDHVRVASFVPGICGSRWDVDILQSHYESESDATEIRVPDAGLAGDADRDGDFDQLDLVRVQVARKYLTGEPATWGDGDWDGWQGRDQKGDGLFNQHDVIAALSLGIYLTSGCDYARKPFAESVVAGSVGPESVGGVRDILDDVEMVHVPEPGSALLCAIGATIGLISRRINRRRAGRSLVCAPVPIRNAKPQPM